MSASIKAGRYASQGTLRSTSAYQAGGLFSAIGGALKGAVTGFVGSGFNPIGAVTGAVKGISGGGGGKSMPGVRPPVLNPPFAGPAGMGVGLPYGPRLSIAERIPAPAPSTNGAGSVSGMHLNKSDYWLKDGTFVPKGSRYVKNRRRNPLNPDALRRAIARVDSGKTWQSKLSEISTGKYTAAGKRKDCKR